MARTREELRNEATIPGVAISFQDILRWISVPREAPSEKDAMLRSAGQLEVYFDPNPEDTKEILKGIRERE